VKLSLSLTGDWAGTAKKLDRGAKDLPAAIRDVVKAEGEGAADAVRGNLDGGVAPSLSPASALLGRQGPPLAGLARNVAVQRLGDAVIVTFKGTTSSGRSAAAVAALQAQGASFSVVATRAQQRFLMALLRERGALPSRVGQRPNPPGTPMTIKIPLPPRDVFGEAARAALEPSVAGPRVSRSLAERMGGVLGDGR
jgi:hypothetical protein